VFLFVGPSRAWARPRPRWRWPTSLYGGERKLISINMSEYQEAHSVSGLKGSPPGYVGYGEGGVLTEAVRRKPYSVVLLDEVEKAHPDVLETVLPGVRQGPHGRCRRPRDRLPQHADHPDLNAARSRSCRPA
jgi:ATP-dependent Clp protease ATP-binding subunit ClpA